jgi:hypothetical protein
VVTLSFAAALFHRVRADVASPSPDGDARQGDGADPSPPPPDPSLTERVRAAAVWKLHPDWKPARVAEAADVSESTARRARTETKP